MKYSKFSDIPKFTQRPAYHVNYYLDAIESAILRDINELGLQLNPDFQRGHVWTREQQIAYIEYLLRGGQSGRDFYFNRIGEMHDFCNLKADFVCVDGLQRITAILAFLRNEIPVFNSYLRDFQQPLRLADVMFSFNVNDLKTRKDVLIWYLEMNSGGTPHTQDELLRVKKLLLQEEEKC
jgi:uncharacterized protein with ParB-like and HNH nuclease domain